MCQPESGNRKDNTMQDDSLEGRGAILADLRDTIRQNEQDMRGCEHTYGCRIGYQEQAEEGAEGVSRSGTFSLRLLVSLLILGGFIWMHMEGISIFGYQSETVVEAISYDVNLQDFMKSDSINNQEEK